MPTREHKPRTYRDADLAEAEASLRKLLYDDKMRGNSPGRYRAAVASARARIETITSALDRRRRPDEA